MKKLFIILVLAFTGATAQAAEIVGLGGLGNRLQNQTHSKMHSVVTIDSASPNSSLKVGSGGGVTASYGVTATTGGITATAGGVTATAGGLTATDGGLTVTAGTIKVPVASAPASAGATGTAGGVRFTAGAIYVCTATNTWKRVAIATWP